MPSSLFNALIETRKQNKRVVFIRIRHMERLIPFGKFGTSKASIARSKINLIMKDNGCGKASQTVIRSIYVSHHENY